MIPLDEEFATLYVLDQLEPADRAAFAARLAHDPALAAFVHSLELTIEQRVRSLPPHTPPADLLARIESQLETSSPAGRERARAPSAPSRAVVIHHAFTRWILPAAAAIALGAATFFYLDRQRAADTRPVVLIVGLDPQRNTVTELPLHDASAGADARFVQLATLAEQFWTRPEKLPHASAATGERHAYALFDPATRQGFIAVQQLPSQPADKRYHLWLVDTATGRALDAGSLPSATSRGLYFFSLDPATTPVSAPVHFLITAEDATSAPPTRPRGEAILGRTPI